MYSRQRSQCSSKVHFPDAFPASPIPGAPREVQSLLVPEDHVGLGWLGQRAGSFDIGAELDRKQETLGGRFAHQPPLCTLAELGEPLVGARPFGLTPPASTITTFDASFL
jgi:hypothetical protein